jgi:peroxiredoxin
VNFWATWCIECRAEMPMLERLHRDLAQRGLVVVGVNIREEVGAARRFAAEQGVTFPVVMDPSGAIATKYGVIGLPTTFLVGRDGRAVALGVGPRGWTTPPAIALVHALLAETAPPPLPAR